MHNTCANGCQVWCGACLAAVQVCAPSHVTYMKATQGLLLDFNTRNWSQ